MHEKSDAQLLRDYAQRGDESAFADLIRRHTNLVYSAAVRQVDSPDLAAEVAQSVFIGLARGAQSLIQRLTPDASLAGWLCRSARNVSLNLQRDEFRRHSRERQAMQQLDSISESAPDWEQLRPVLDEAMSELDETDYDALVLRFFKNQDLRSVGLAQGVSDDTAQKRVSRALDKLRDYLSRRGIRTTTTALSVVLTTNAIQAAPIGLALTISSAAAIAGTTLATAATATATKAIAMTTLQKALLTTAVVATVGTGVFQAQRNSALREQVATLQQMQTPLTEQLQNLNRDQAAANQTIAVLQEENERLKNNTSELLRLRSEVSLLRGRSEPTPRETGLPSSQAQTSVNLEVTPEDIGRQLGMAVVRGDFGALDKVREFARVAHDSFNTNSPGLSDDQRDDLSRKTFAPLQSAFEMVSKAAAEGNQFALDAVARSIQIPELQGQAVKSLGALAGNGNTDALDILLNRDEHGLLRSGTVAALKPAADNGNQKAIDALAEVARDVNAQPLWFMAADGLSKAAESGNAVAIDTLISLSASTNSNVQRAAASGLKRAASGQNPKAVEALRALGIQ